jgi:TonB dependent receptor
MAFGIKPTHELGLFAYINYFHADVELGKATELGTYDGIAGSNSRGDFGARYEFSPQSQLWIKFGAGTENSSDRETVTYVATAPTTTSGSNFVTRPDGTDAQIRHTFAATDEHRVTWGYSWGKSLTPVNLVSDAYLSVASASVPVDTLHEYVTDRSDEFYVSDLYTPNQQLSIDAELADVHYHRFRDTSILRNRITYEIAQDIPETWGGTEVQPRAGFVYRFAPDQLVRIAYQRWTRPTTYNTISPVATAGIPLDDQIVFAGGRLSRTRGQVEWAWSHTTFTSAFFDYEQVNNLDSPLDGVQNTRSDLEQLDRLRNLTLTTLPPPNLLEGTPIFSEGRIASAGTSIDQIVNRELSLSAGYVYSDGSNTNPLYAGNMIPYIPRQRANLNATWTNNNRFYISAQAIYRTRRYLDEANTMPLASSWDALLRAYWESTDKKWVVETYAENLLKKDFSNLYGVNLTLRY